jgi:hypothetical protein
MFRDTLKACDLKSALPRANDRTHAGHSPGPDAILGVIGTPVDVSIGWLAVVAAIVVGMATAWVWYSDWASLAVSGGS